MKRLDIPGMGKYDLLTIFEMCEWPFKKKHNPYEGRNLLKHPPYQKTLEFFRSKDFNVACWVIGDLKLKAETKEYLRTLYYYEDEEGEVLALIEESKGKDDSKGKQ